MRIPVPSHAMICVLLFASLLTCQFTSASERTRPQSPNAPIHSAAAAKRLPAVESERKIPVALHGVVTCVPEGWKGFFLEDESGGIYCEPQDIAAEKSFWPVHVGEEVKLVGVTAPGHRNSFVAVKNISWRKSGVLPQPTLRTIRNTIDDRIDADFVRVRGHIVGLVNIAGEMEYGLFADGVEAEVVHAGFRIDPKVYEHAEVEVRGTVIPQEGNARPIKIVVPDATAFKLLKTHREVQQSTQLQSIKEVLQQDVDSNPVVKISGDIFCDDADSTWLIDNGFGINWQSNGTVLPEQTKNVELMGILQHDGARRWVKYGTVLSMSTATREPQFNRAIVSTHFDSHVNQLVSVTATFWDSNAFDSDIIMSFDIENSKLTCRLLDLSATGQLSQLQRGAEYRISGLLVPVAMSESESPTLLIRSLADVAMVSGPPWPVRFTLYIVSLLSLGLTIGLMTTVIWWQQAISTRRSLEEARNELRYANENLEARVADRTLELDATNRRLTEEATARILVEQDQIETLASLEDAQSLAQIGSFVWYAVTRSSVWSKQCFLIHGLDPQGLPMGFDDYCACVLDEDRAAFKTYLQKAAVSSEREEFRYRITLPSGEVRWVRSLLKSLLSPDGTLISIKGIIQNVTDQVSAEEQLRHSVKMEVAGHLAGGIAHDLNNTLAIVKLNCFLLHSSRNADALSAEFLSHVAAIEAAADKSAMLTRQLLTFSRKQLIRPIVLNVNTTIQTFSPLLRPLLENRVTIEFHLADQIADVRLDEGQLEQILMNLIINARDAIPETGTIQVRTSNWTVSRDADPSQWILPPKCGEYVSLSVTDNGLGISPDSIHRIFEPFFSTKGPDKGTGLGLAVVHGIVRQNHGGLSIKSQPNLGTTFQLLIPVATEAESITGNETPYFDVQPIDELVKAQPASRGSILLVDDEPSVGKHTENVLKRLGYDVTTFLTAGDALRFVKASPHDFQLLITDYSMPHMSGLELATQIRDIIPNVPVILMSGFLNEEAFRNMPAGLDPVFIPKPFTIPELATSIRKAIKQADTVHIG